MGQISRRITGLRALAAAALACSFVVVAAGCSRSRGPSAGAPSDAGPPVEASSSNIDDAAATPSLEAGAPAELLADEDVGPLIARLSEDPGRFPSDNYVTNETSLLDVAPALRDPKLRDRAYVGVGPDQNYTYMAMLEPRVAYIVDIRRGNLLEHMFFRACFEAGASRVAFLSALLARRPRDDAGAPGDIAEILSSFHGVPGDAALRDESLSRTRALLDRLRFVRRAGDDAELSRIHAAFYARGLSIAYAMSGSHRRYPTLEENFAARDPTGARGTFLASEETYARVRRLVLDNRVLPVVGDYGGKHALAAVAADMRDRGVVLGALYTSNVEQYLFDARTYGAFVESVRAMPRDDASLLVRVWFDQGRGHPAQRPGHRTTQLSMGATAFVERAARRPFRSYAEVVDLAP
jgi:hypothetical protein